MSLHVNLVTSFITGGNTKAVQYESDASSTSVALEKKNRERTGVSI